ncbi:MAG TPA: hypothetical protein VLA76_06845 [Candidatus Angelobacter sp.]|nr:hypothetical protein [Candidatus Angelobacter sp.]
MRRALVLSIPLLLAVPIAYGVAFDRLGHAPMLLPALAGAGGWLLALLLRAPVGLLGMHLAGTPERAQRWVVASSGPLEEAVRLAVLLLVGRDLGTALWIGLGWATIEVLYSIGNGFAVAALAERTDPEAERARAMLPPAALAATSPLWGVVERAWASALHIGFTLILAAVPLLVLVTAPLHTAINVGVLWLARHRGLLVVSAAGIALGATVLAAGWLLHVA